jgi:methylphosphotriester-DNA--protein-cysteine methyltransferase
MISAEAYAASPGRMTGHGHDDWHVCAVLDGAFEERFGKSSKICGAGELRISRPGSAHDLEFGSTGADCLILEARGAFWPALLARMVAKDKAHAFRQAAPEALRLFAGSAAASDASERLSALIALGPLLAGADDGPASAWVEEARDAIVSSDGRIALARFASVLGLARADFARGFQRSYGFRPVEYRALHRARAALALLRAGAPFAEAALDAGYAHQSHMNNSLRAILGTTPSALAPPNLQYERRAACIVP